MTELILPFRGRLAALLLAAALPLQALAQAVAVDQQDPRLRVEQIASGLGVPWGMAFLSPTRLLITERSGRLRLLDLEGLYEPLGDVLRSGRPVLATCAGLILLAAAVTSTSRSSRELECPRWGRSFRQRGEVESG